MTFTEIVAEVMDRLNLTSTEAQTRIGKRVNDRYKRVTSAIGMLTSRRLSVDVTLNSLVDTELPEYTNESMEKINRITTLSDGGGLILLEQRTYDDIVNERTLYRVPRAWGVKRQGAGEVTIVFDGYPLDTDFDLTIEGYEILDTLSGTDVPFMPTDFHDILVEGVMSDEQRKMEKMDFAQMAESKYEQRLSDLKMFIAKSGYLDQYQSKSKNYGWPYKRLTWKSY